MLREFGQYKLQPLLMRLARKEVIKRIGERLLPLVTVQDCRECPALEHCQNACVGFRNLYLKEAEKC
jgi:radical SAM protein with 4Fe4S-binding SPASM domain